MGKFNKWYSELTTWQRCRLMLVVNIVVLLPIMIFTSLSWWVYLCPMFGGMLGSIK